VRLSTCCRQSQVPLAGSYQLRQFAQVWCAHSHRAMLKSVQPPQMLSMLPQVLYLYVLDYVHLAYLCFIHSYVSLCIVTCIMGTKPLKSTCVIISIGDAFVHSKHGGHFLSTIWVVTLLALVFDMMSYSVLTHLV
jgi:hypothetical protein